MIVPAVSTLDTSTTIGQLVPDASQKRLIVGPVMAPHNTTGPVHWDRVSFVPSDAASRASSAMVHATPAPEFSQQPVQACIAADRPHQALAMKVPGDLYARSPRIYRGLDELTYPFYDTTITVTHCGRICFKGQKVNLSHAFAGQNVGVTQAGEWIWLVTSYSTIWATSTTRRAGWNRARIRSARKCYLCLRNELSPMCPEWTGASWLLRLDSNQQPSD
jgi:hypothetical protein